MYEQLIKYVERYEEADDKRRFYEFVRSEYNSMLPGVNAATFLFLNRTCWNGLYRLNRDGMFNVPHGSHKGRPSFPSLDDLLNASAALKQTQLRAGGWENIVASCDDQDFIFFDPPYYSDIAREPKYSETHFDLTQHRRLARLLSALKKRGVEFLLTNSGEDEIVSLYRAEGLYVEKTLVPRSISSDIENRIPAQEIVVTPKLPLRLS